MIPARRPTSLAALAMSAKDGGTAIAGVYRESRSEERYQYRYYIIRKFVASSQVLNFDETERLSRKKTYAEIYRKL